ncbi:uncharacterized protein [Palaemon carinicauda]|uniref:uncharacterized protein n=1 Tax=Palaemon carinicauda TaxID=392227 RepID=UPI0035B5F325
MTIVPLCANKVSISGHRIPPLVVRLLPDKVASFQKFSTPSTVKKLREYLGMINYYHCFLLAITTTLAFLSPLCLSQAYGQKPEVGLLREATFCNYETLQGEIQLNTFELLVVHFALRHFRNFFEDMPFIIRMDHNLLVHAFCRQSDT